MSKYLIIIFIILLILLFYYYTNYNFYNISTPISKPIPSETPIVTPIPSETPIPKPTPNNYYPTPKPVQLIPYKVISQRQQWLPNFGYCGETSFITCAMYYGMYMSQYDLRRLTSVSNTQSKESDQILIGTLSEIIAANLFKLSFDRWIGNNKTTNDFINWMIVHTNNKDPVISVVYENQKLLGTKNGTSPSGVSTGIGFLNSSIWVQLRQHGEGILVRPNERPAELEQLVASHDARGGGDVLWVPGATR